MEVKSDERSTVIRDGVYDSIDHQIFLVHLVWRVRSLGIMDKKFCLLSSKGMFIKERLPLLRIYKVRINIIFHTISFKKGHIFISRDSFSSQKMVNIMDLFVKLIRN